jgi:serine phosphatase RsbU (regulator of sigma subunit)
MSEVDIKSPSFQRAELRSECARVSALLVFFGSLLALVLVRGIVSLADGRQGEAWPFAAILLITAVYEVGWLRFIRGVLDSGGSVSSFQWKASIVAESLLPTTALLLQVHTSIIGPRRALTSPVMLAYFVLIILSTLHLDVGLARLCGWASAIGYSLVAIYTLAVFPQATDGDKLVAYGMAFSCAALLIIGGVAAGAVAAQLRLHVVTALHEAQGRAKFEHDMGIARSIQQGLLPKAPPEVEGFDIAGWNRPADETGGDYFDWLPVTDGRLALTIADVTGHGIGPAICMASCRAYARAALAEGPPLQDFLATMNDLLYEDLPLERFVTMAAGLLDPADATLELISAGHGPLLFYLSAEDRFRSYDAQGLPLGMMPRLQYGSPQMLTFAPGDILVFVTDGFVEWANFEDEDFGQRRLTAVIRKNRHRPSSAIVHALYTAVLEFAGTKPQLDDLTVIVVKRTRPQAALRGTFPEK